MMRDQRGMTLVELLASTTITLLVLLAAFSVYYAIHTSTESGMQRYRDKSAMDGVMSRLTGELTDATAVWVTAAGDELRYTNGSAARAIVHDAGAKTLTLYEFSAGADPAVKRVNLTDASISLAARPELYTNPRELPAVVAGVQYFNGQGMPIAGAAVDDGRVIRLSVTFETDVSGEAATRTVETAVKLFDDAA